MKIGSVCNSCFQLYSLVIEPEDTELLGTFTEGQLAPCPRQCGGRINVTAVKELKVPKESRMYKEPIEITVKELHAAIFGNGLPDEIPRDPLVVESMLLSHRIKSVELRDSGPIKGAAIYLDSVLLENGVRVHLGGGMGARVVKLTKEAPNGTVADR